MHFDHFELASPIAAGVNAMGFTQPTPIQEKAIPLILEGRDVMGLAQTGTGKTAAFVLPILHRLWKRPDGRPKALILAPTRELAEQTHQATELLAKKTRLKMTRIYGGVGIQPQIRTLFQGVDIVSACPGRLLDHMTRGTIDLSGIEVLVLDEADQMFDMGFLPDIRRILRRLPKERQTLLFSATMPDAIKHLVKEALQNPLTVQSEAAAPASTVSHTFYPVAAGEKNALLERLLSDTPTGPVIVFTRTKHRSKTLALRLERNGYEATALHGNLTQNRRQQALEGFHRGRYKILVATDIAARGIDVSSVSHVINYDIPSTVDAYTHRIGRTGRALKTGDAYTFVSSEDRQLEQAIKRVLGNRLTYCTVKGFGCEMNTAAPAPAPHGPHRKTRSFAPAGGTAHRQNRR